MPNLLSKLRFQKFKQESQGIEKLNQEEKNVVENLKLTIICKVK